MRVFPIAILMLLTYAIFAQVPKVSNGFIRHFSDFQSEYVNPRNVDVWLPENYDENKKFNVLYMHDGQMLFDSTITWNGQEWQVDETMWRLMNQGKIQETIVVGIWNDGEYRHTDYLPGKALDLMPKKLADSLINYNLMGESKSDDYLKFIVTELKPFIDSTFSTNADRSHTYIMGSSMGGLISMYAICEYPGVFGGAVCMSTHWYGMPVSWNRDVPEAYLQYIEENLPDANFHKLYFDHGSKTLDAYYAPFQQRADEIIKENGYSYCNFVSLIFEGAEHKEDDWAARLEIPLLFLLEKK